MTTLIPLNTRILSTNTPPEMQLILCCARNVDDANAERIQTLIKTADIDWQDVINNAYKHGLMPLLYTNLNARAKGDLSITPSQSEIEASAKDAGIHDKIMRLPDGYVIAVKAVVFPSNAQLINVKSFGAKNQLHFGRSIGT